jgi:chaperonin GroES
MSRRSRDVTSGDASNNGQVGTTLALIEQGLQVFTAIYKRVYRSLKSEFKVLFDNISRYGGDKAAEDYANVLDDTMADFKADFNTADMDIRPVSDPNSVTRLQKMAKAQFLLQTGKGDPMVDQRELMMRVYEAADVEDIEKLIPPPVQSGPDPMMVAEVNKLGSEIERNEAQADLYRAQAERIGVLAPVEADKTKADTAKIGADIGTMLADGEPNGDNTGRLPEMV